MDKQKKDNKLDFEYYPTDACLLKRFLWVRGKKNEWLSHKCS